MTTTKNALFLLPLFGLVIACGGGDGPTADSPGATEGAGSDTGPDSDGDASGGIVVTCTPPPLLNLDDIPDDPSLDPGDDDVVATFEVDGHDLIGKFVTDEDAAEGGLKLWQEFTLRIPENQLLDLVQLDISRDTDPVAYFNRNGNVTTSRLGLKIGFSVENFALNQADPCAPLEPRRGTFDWSLVHEFGHLRGFVDGSWPAFLTTFEDVSGDGEGYPDDGSPVLTGDFVTSYAERADGDEDHAETWTTYVMLAASQIPEATPGESLALQKIHWMDQQPGLRELRDALRITENDAVTADVPPAPRLDDSVFDPGGDDSVLIPAALHGQWRQSTDDGHRVTFTADNIVLSRYEDGAQVERLSIAEAQAADALNYFEVHNGSATLAYSFIEERGGDRFNHDFYLQDDPQTLLFRRERLDTETFDLEQLEDIQLTKVD